MIKKFNRLILSVLDQETENKRKGRIMFLMGFLFALGAWNYKLLWEDAFYHLIALSFVCFIMETWVTETSKVWLIIRGFVMITALNNLKDELIGEGYVFKIGEYVAFTFIAIFTANRILKLYYKK